MSDLNIRNEARHADKQRSSVYSALEFQSPYSQTIILETLKLVPYKLSLRFHGPESFASNADSVLSVYSDLDFQAPEALFSNDHFKNLETLKHSPYFI